MVLSIVALEEMLSFAGKSKVGVLFLSPVKSSCPIYSSHFTKKCCISFS